MLQELLRAVGKIDVNDIELEAVGLRNREDGGGAGVELRGRKVMSAFW